VPSNLLSLLPMKKLYVILSVCAVVLFTNTASAQCALSIATTASTVCTGDNVTLSAIVTPPVTSLALTSTLAGGNNHRGNMFDIFATNSVTITSFDAHPMGNTTIAVYYRTSPYAGFETSSAGWTLIGSAAVTAQPFGTPTPVPVTVNVTIPAGQTYSFYVTSTNTAVSLNYTDGTTEGATYVSDANIVFRQGVGMEYPFSNGGGVFRPRVWNGVIHYTVPQVVTTNYLWSTAATTSSINPTLVNTTQYTLQADVTGCPTMYDTVTVAVSTPPVNAGADFAVCAGLPATLSGSGAVSYSWDNSVTDGMQFTPATTLSYIVTGTDTIGCTNTDTIMVTVNNLPAVNAGADFAVCAGAQATLSGSGAVSYSWDNSVADGVPFTPASTLSYIVTGTDANGCTNTDTTIVTVNPLPVVYAGADQSVCADAMVTLSGSGAVSYSWDNSVTDGVPFLPVATMNYIVTGTDANGCMNTDTVLVTQFHFPAVDAGLDQTVCSGSAVTLTGSGAATYSWDNSVSDGVPFFPLSTMTYNVTGTDTNGCTGTDDVIVNVITVSASTTVLNETMTASPIAAVYQWINCSTNAAIPGATAQTYTATANGSYAVIVTINGCSDTSACQAISSVGIDEAGNSIFSVYPNPTNGQLTLDLGNVTAENVSVMDVLGNTLIDFKPSGQLSAINLEGYANGTYFIRISMQGEMKMIRVTKQ
jgi:hypothetical protein